MLTFFMPLPWHRNLIDVFTLFLLQTLVLLIGAWSYTRNFYWLLLYDIGK